MDIIRFFLALFLAVYSVYAPKSRNSTKFIPKSHYQPYLARLKEEWVSWKLQHRKRYLPHLEDVRFNTWLLNSKQNEVHNSRYQLGQEFYRRGLNRFSDFAATELKRMLYAEIPLDIIHQNINPVRLPLHRNVPGNLSWTDQVPSLALQAKSIFPTGWAISAAEAVQTQVAITKGRCRNLSVKEILDCQQATLGHGMISMNALSYIFAQGLTFESHYPSVHPRPTRCKYKPWHPRVRIRGYHLLEPFNEDNLKSAVALIGPVTANIKVTDDFFFYQSGVFYDQACKMGEPVSNHAVLVVGYDTDPVGGDYWVIQNNWGAHWGENGFGKVARNSIFNCGIDAATFYVVV